MDRISDIISETELVSDIRKEFCTEILKIRYENILEPALKKVHDLEKGRALDVCMERTAERSPKVSLGQKRER